MTQPPTTVFVDGRPTEVTGVRVLAQGAGPGGWATLFGSAEGVYFVQRREGSAYDAHDDRVWMEGIAAVEAAALFAELQHKKTTFEGAFGGVNG